ncbi:MAG: SCO family protein [Castellaniella sp.]|uniref:SCO family protein n=1 Tax=Castellaniella sp. TaxID=1955812 RepID=UPI002A35AC9D|nr:SCO family protein [Castellaniella sp.]MDY0309322.1 SCO family protein [Castellaniella sp.]
MRWILALAVALAAGLGALYGLTDGFTVLTAEAARRQDVARNPRPIPAVQVLYGDGRIQSLNQDLRRDGRIAIVNFFYTRCLSLCLVQGSLTERLQRAIVEHGLQDRIRLISISFDPRERPSDLSRYAVRMNADPAVWQFLSFAQPAQRDAALDLFGITVVPAPLGEFEHNAAFHIVTPDGRLARVLDLDDPGLALLAAKDEAERGLVPAGAVPGEPERRAGEGRT